MLAQLGTFVLVIGETTLEVYAQSAFPALERMSLRWKGYGRDSPIHLS